MNSESNSMMSNSGSASNSTTPQNSTTAQVGMNSSMSTRRNNRRNNRKNNSRRGMDGGKGKKRKASKWNLFTKKIFMEMKKKMGKKASFKMALKEASRRKKEM